MPLQISELKLGKANIMRYIFKYFLPYRINYGLRITNYDFSLLRFFATSPFF
jgi:hypothetical protein